MDICKTMEIVIFIICYFVLPFGIPLVLTLLTLKGLRKWEAWNKLCEKSDYSVVVVLGIILYVLFVAVMYFWMGFN